MRVFRIARAKYPGLDGTGAKLSGGRWNSAGVPVVYTSGSRALAALEKLVWVNPDDIPADLRLFEIEIPDDAPVETVATQELPASWRQASDPHCLRMGDEWLRSRRSLAIAVPSAIMPEEPNYLLNPAHPHMPAVKVSRLRDFNFDARLFKPKINYVGRVFPPPAG